MDTSVEDGRNIVAIFGQWGSIQLLLALLLWVCSSGSAPLGLLLRYRGFVPLILLVFLTEPLLRGVAGHLKPIETVGTAPGAALNWIVVPVLTAFSASHFARQTLLNTALEFAETGMGKGSRTPR